MVKKMEEVKKIKIQCNLTTRGSDKIDGAAMDDLTVPDPEPATGKKIVEEMLDVENKNDERSNG